MAKNVETIHAEAIAADYYFGPGIYFLYSGGRIVYVGQSVNIASRLADHAGTFDRATYFVVPKERLNDEEKRWIRELCPERNKKAGGHLVNTKIRFTKGALERYPVPATGRVYVYDSLTPSLALAVTHTGHRAFYLYLRVGGRPERIHIGPFPELTVEQARRKAAELRGDIARGENPADRRRRIIKERRMRLVA